MMKVSNITARNHNICGFIKAKIPNKIPDADARENTKHSRPCLVRASGCILLGNN